LKPSPTDAPPGLFRALVADMAELDVAGPRAAAALATTLSVVLAVLAALALRLDGVWWAGISGFMVSQSTGAASIEKGLQRIAGTAAGAALAFIVMRWIAYDHLAARLFLLSVTTVGVLGFETRHGYAWLLGAATAAMIVLMSLEHPEQTLHVAVYRFADVGIGSLIAMLVALALAETPASAPAPATQTPGFLDATSPARLAAASAGVSVMLIPSVWSALHLPMSAAQMGVTAIVVAAVPAAGVSPAELFATALTRALHRLLGCFIGGAAALLLLMIPLASLLPWLLCLAGGVFIAAHLQTSARGIGYVGVQAGVVFIMTLVQGQGPPQSIWPGAERFAGMALSLAILFVVSLLLWPAAADAAAPSSDPC
jgi:uncharacterized membrane protein YccC